MSLAAVLGIGLAILWFVVNVIMGCKSSNQGSSEDARQLDGLEDGQGTVFVNGEYLTRQEAEDAQARGELYDTYY